MASDDLPTPTSVSLVDGCYVFSTDGAMRRWFDEQRSRMMADAAATLARSKLGPVVEPPRPGMRFDDLTMSWVDDAPSYRSREGLDGPTDITADDASAIGRALRARK